MRPSYVTLLTVLLLTTVAARAQEFPQWEAFGGFSYANINLGPQAGIFSPSTKSYYGFDLAANFNPHRIVGLLVDVNFEFGRTTANPPPGFTNVHLQNTQLLFGPQFALRGSKAAAFANVLVGVNNARLQAQSGTIYEDIVRQNDFALGFGGGVDVTLTRRVAIRAIQAEYVPTQRSGRWENQYRVNTGLVFRFDFH
jgi:opacity protein-like surface antigen